MKITLRDVADRAGVSRSAVSRTFTAGASVSEATRAKVLRAASELGYAPSALASALSTGRTKLIGLVASNFENPFFLRVFDLFTARLQQAGLRPLLVNLSDTTNPDASVRMLRQYSVDGVIVVSSTLPTLFSRAFHEAGLPVVHCFARATGAPEVHVTGIDDIATGALAARTLRDRGYRRLGFLGGPPGTSATRDRMTGFRQVAGPDAPAIHAAAYSHAAGRSALLGSGLLDRVDGWFGADDILSIGALSALRASGLRVPHDVGLIGVNDLDMAGWPEIGLSTLHMPLPEIVGAMDRARDAGVPLIFDIDYRPYSWTSADEAREVLGRAARAAQIVVGNDTEFDVLGDGLAAARSLVDHGAALVIYKMGPQGALTLWPGGEMRTGIYPVTALKPVGAGDAFLGTALVALATGTPLREAILRGSAAAAIVVARVGCAPAIPTPGELDDFMARATPTDPET